MAKTRLTSKQYFIPSFNNVFIFPWGFCKSFILAVLNKHFQNSLPDISITQSSLIQVTTYLDILLWLYLQVGLQSKWLSLVGRRTFLFGIGVLMFIPKGNDTFFMYLIVFVYYWLWFAFWKHLQIHMLQNWVTKKPDY